MKKYNFIILLFLIKLNSYAQMKQDFIATNIISRTIQIKYNNSTGTCFNFDYNGKQYFITAKHVIENLKNDEFIELFYQNKWQKHQVKLIGHSSYSDISVFATPNFLNQSTNINATYDQMVYGQELFFLGFPYGIQNMKSNFDSKFPLPFVKKAILSNFINDSQTKILFLDGINNPGFSGGPIVFYNYQSKKMELCGIISGYRPEIKNTTQNNSDINIQYSINTGIIIAYGIKDAIELIEANPIGVKL